MSNNSRNQELTSAAIVVIGYTDRGGRECQDKCVVPASLLWSPNGLVEFFEALRAGLMGKQDEQNGDEWDSFHIVSMQEDTDCLILSDGPDWRDA